jgi:hypothetical protein
MKPTGPEEKDDDDDFDENDSCNCEVESSFGSLAGYALLMFVFLFGVGSCSYLMDTGYAKRIEAETRAKVIEKASK